MKRKGAWLIGLLILVLGLAACGRESQTTNHEGVTIVTTIFPEYDWVREILGENPADAEVVMLLDNGVDLHSFQPNAQDIMKISTCDLFIYVGGESDEWVNDALKEAVNPDMIVIDLLDVLGDAVKEEEVIEGMEAEEEGEGEEEGPEYDEHVWLSLKHAKTFVGEIAQAIETIDPDHADVYLANASAYQEKLTKLDEAYEKAVSEAEKKVVLFGDRFPFRYLVDDYGLTYYAAFAGCSAETEASFETVIFLAGKADELGLLNICTLESSDGKIAETIRETTSEKNQSIVTFDSMQSTTMQDVQAGETYLTIMEKNLEALTQSLQ